MTTTNKNISSNKVIDLQIESLKGTQVSINGDMSKMITIFENDVNFIKAVEGFRKDLEDYMRLSEEYAKTSVKGEDVTEEEIDGLIEVYEKMSLELKENFTKIFRVEGTYEIVFGDVLDPYQIFDVISGVLNICYSSRKEKTSKYTKKYK